MCKNSLFIPQSMKSKQSFLFYFKIAKELSEFRNYLPDYQKEVIILRFYHNLKIREIAKITKSNIPTVKSRLRQGLQKIERYLNDFKGGDNV